MTPEAMQYLALAIACLAMAVVGIGESMAVMKGMESIGRNPAAAKEVRSSMIIGVGLIESIAIYILVISILMAFAI